MSKDTEWHSTKNNDTGSLRTGNEKLAVGDRIQIEGESRTRHVTYVMGSDANGWHAAFANQGAVPEGQLRWRIAEHPSSPPHGQSSPVTNNLPDLSKKTLGEWGAMLMPGQIWTLASILATMLAGAFSLGLWVAKQSPTTKAEVHSDRWLVIEGIEAVQHEAVRITVSVNGENYISYPSGHVWAEIKPNMSKEKYPLPYEDDTYSLRFGAFLSTRGQTQKDIEARCRESSVVAVNALPAIDYTCDLFPSDVTNWGGTSIGTITYSVFGG
jgi:hypothetical protein